MHAFSIVGKDPTRTPTVPRCHHWPRHGQGSSFRVSVATTAGGEEFALTCPRGLHIADSSSSDLTNMMRRELTDGLLGRFQRAPKEQDDRQFLQPTDCASAEWLPRRQRIRVTWNPQ
jgi:hypothetical protein